MSNETEHCPHCGAKMVEYAHTLSKNILRGFVRIVQSHAPKNTFLFSECDPLSYSQASNIHKLRYWGLIKKVDDSAGKGGDWVITQIAFDFLSGRQPLHPKVWTYRGKVQRFDGEPKYIHEITGGWKYRVDYAQERLPHKPVGELI